MSPKLFLAPTDHEAKIVDPEGNYFRENLSDDSLIAFRNLMDTINYKIHRAFLLRLTHREKQGLELRLLN